MTAADNSAILARIDERLDATGKSARQASVEATGGPSTIQNMRKGSKPAVDMFERLAPVLGTTPEYLAFGVSAAGTPAAEAANANVPLIGQVAAGLWLDVDTEVDAPLYEDVPIPADPEYPIDWQFAVEVRGTSVNQTAPDGAILGCVDVRKARRQPREGELVIVEQRRNAGLQIMRTAKRFHVVAGTFELRPDSTDPKWRTPIVIRPGEEDESTQIEVIGIVTWVHAPLQRLDRLRRN